MSETEKTLTIRRKITSKLREKREKLGKSNYAVAQEAGIRHMLLKAIENGGNPTLDTLIKICDALNFEITLKDKKKV